MCINSRFSHQCVSHRKRGNFFSTFKKNDFMSSTCLLSICEFSVDTFYICILPEILYWLEYSIYDWKLQLLERGTKLVLEQVVTTIASVADTAEEQFVAFYDRLGRLILFFRLSSFLIPTCIITPLLKLFSSC